MRTRRLQLSPLWRVPVALAMAAAIGGGGCAGGGSTEPHQPIVAITLPRALSPAEQDVLGAANAFSFALWGRLNQASRDSNVFVSPLSASFALGMALDGANGRTFDEMRSGLQFGSTSGADINIGYKSLIALLASLDPAVTMQIANSIWYRKTFPFNQSFLNDGATYFGAAVSPLDFSDVPGSLGTINGWVNAQTNGKIPSILDAIESDDVMFLINAIYFKASWRDRFDASETHSAPFHSVRGDEQAQLMHRKHDMSYAETPTFQAVDLPYGDSAFTMTVLLPKSPADVESVAASLTPAAWQSLTSSFASRDVDLSLPKLSLEWKHDLIPDLQALGMQTPFVPGGADFTRMSPLGAQLYISLVRQKTYVSVDEEGTEAAAVTGVGVTVTAVEVPAVMRVDRPYLFVIRERLTGTVLFMGKIVAMPQS